MWDLGILDDFQKRATRRSSQLAVTVIAALLLSSGCGPPAGRYPQTIGSQDPLVRVKAIIHAGQIKDESVVPLLVDRLEDEDSGVRFYAILALERIVGTRMGYDYGAPIAQRQEAVARWRNYVAERNAPVATKHDRPTKAE